jgi:hypothetical protein
MHYFFAQSLFQQGYSNIPIFLPLGIALSLLIEAWKNEPISIVFWIISLGLAFAVSGGLYINKSFSKSNSKSNPIGGS